MFTQKRRVRQRWRQTDGFDVWAMEIAEYILGNSSLSNDDDDYDDDDDDFTLAHFLKSCV